MTVVVVPVTGFRLDRRGEANTREREQRDTRSHDLILESHSLRTSPGQAFR
jgi:hypothetical protein